MNRIDKKFRDLKKNKRKVFISFIMAGDPDLPTTKKLIFELEKNGTDIIELGIPFSDPLADGPTIQRSSERALKKGANLDSASNMVKDVRKISDTPIVFLIYYNLLHYYGLERSIKKMSSSGVDGIVVPDLPIEESYELRKISKKYNFSLIHLAAPTSSKKRLKMIGTASTGFVYYVSLTGTTGARKALSKEIFKNLKEAKELIKKPICVGFGISSREQVRSISKSADGVIVGSAIIKIIEENRGKKSLIKDVGSFVKTLSFKT
ncbi:MAG: tryptophan synthase subunit alpha [Candidatus Omnitrophota bacterium]